MRRELPKKPRGAHKNAKSKAGNAARKAANIARAPKSWRQRGLTPLARLAELDKQYGRGVGAEKERDKLHRLISRSDVAA